MIDTTYFGQPWQPVSILLKIREIVKLLILGLAKTTLLDYPGKLAATIFTGGCNFRCPYCHNGDLVLNVDSSERISENDILDFLKKRTGRLEGVCISGGEPTCQVDLVDFVKKAKALDYFVKLDTNGTNPDIVKELIENELIDYVAMDIKNSPDKYKNTIGDVSNFDFENIVKTKNYLIENRVEYEFRTTLVKGLHTKNDIIDMHKFIVGAKKWYLQSYVESDRVINPIFEGFTRQEIDGLITDVIGSDIEINIRGLS